MFVDSTLILCTRCAHLFEQGAHDPNCPQCGHTVHLETYRPLIRFAAEANRYGVDYREVYQEVIDEGNEDRVVFSLSSDEIASFLAMAALSGIIGNASFEMLKLTFRRIKTQMFALREREAKRFDWSIVEDEEKIRRFFELLEEFERGMPDFNQRVRLMILHEMAIDYKVSQIYTDQPDPKKEQKAALQLLAEQRILRKPPLLEEFAEFWSQVESNPTN